VHLTSLRFSGASRRYEVYRMAWARPLEALVGKPW